MEDPETEAEIDDPYGEEYGPSDNDLFSAHEKPSQGSRNASEVCSKPWKTFTASRSCCPS